MIDNVFSIALVGNPNSGKTSLFNSLTGLHQKVGNFAGVTVEKKIGTCKLSPNKHIKVIDLPGTYSLYPKGQDERVVFDVLIDPNNAHQPDLAVIVADASNLKRNLLLCSQIMDLNIPVILALSMTDIAATKGIQIDIAALQQILQIPVLSINPRKNIGIDELKKTLLLFNKDLKTQRAPFIPLDQISGSWIEEYKVLCQAKSNYAALQTACQLPDLSFISAETQVQHLAYLKKVAFKKTRFQAEEILERYRKIDQIINQTVQQASISNKVSFSERLDKLLLHPIWGNLILLLFLFILFQSIFTFSAYPMDWVEQGFSSLSAWLALVLPSTWWADLFINGIIAGIGGVLVFVPQIMVLFGLITIVEDSGYMARVSFLTDRLMRSSGLNGRSVMPMISGMACAVPAIMAARTIQNQKERLITILITPLMSCSARLPVYTILIGLVIPSKSFLGFFNLQGLVMLGLYLLGFVMALVAAKVMQFFIKTKEQSFFLLELPVYRAPRWKNVGITMLQKAQIFVINAGKIILLISIILWRLSSYGPQKRMQALEQKYDTLIAQNPNNSALLEQEYAQEKLAHSYAGILGHSIEPLIKPLGYDWKIGIALITSFAAREVFVGTMATLYSVGADAEQMDKTLREKLSDARRSDGTKVYTLGTGVSLLMFYVFAMQCMSTMVITKKETGSWKYPLIQFAYMGFLAYLFAFVAFQTL